jgi:phosphatidylinositol glycan class B
VEPGAGADRADRTARWLWGILLLAATLRIVAATAPGFHHPDAIYQYLEPAYRLLTGMGVVTWEWRAGIRSWLLPLLLAGPMWVGERIDATSALPVLLPRLTMAGASLSLVWSAWRLGGRASMHGALLAGFVAAIWFEFIHFGVQTLAEPVAVAVFLPAAILVTAASPRRRAFALAGGLLTFAVLMRPHYAPAAAALVIAVAWPVVTRRVPLRDVRPGWFAFALGCLPVLFVSAGIDIATGARPFAWIVENVRQNIVEQRAAAYGVLPPLTYVVWFEMLWQWWTIPLLIGVRFGWRLCSALVIAALVNLLLHSLIGHKEYRFVFLTSAALVTVSAAGWAVLLQLAVQRWPVMERWRMRAGIATVAVAAAWGAASLLLARSDEMRHFIERGRPGSVLFAALRRDPQTCGVGLVDRPAFADVPGRVSLRAGTPVFMFLRGDPALGRATPWVAAQRWQGGFNRIIALLPPGPLPPGYRRGPCDVAGEYTLCLFSRPGPCRDARQSPFALDRAMLRLGF